MVVPSGVPATSTDDHHRGLDRRRSLAWCALALTATAAALGARVPAGASSGRAPRCGASEGAAVVEEAAPDAVGGLVTASDGPAGPSQVLHVRVPPGRLYLEPGHLTVRIPAGDRAAVLPDVLLADLRDDNGWQLELTVTAIRGGDEVRVVPARPRPVAGERWSQARPGPAVAVAAGGCAVVALAAPDLAWGSWFQSIELRVDGALGTEPVDVDVDLRLLSRR